MIGLFKWLFLGVAALLAGVFSVNNRLRVTVDLFPLPYEIDLALYHVVFAGMLIGVLVGGTSVWFSVVKWRLIARKQEKQIKALEDSSLKSTQSSKELI